MKEFQAELDRRTQVEEQAMALIAECKFEEANALLNSLDDKTFVQMLDWEENEQCMEEVDAETGEFFNEEMLLMERDENIARCIKNERAEAAALKEEKKAVEKRQKVAW